MDNCAHNHINKEAAWEKTASWEDVRNKAIAICSYGGVEIYRDDAQEVGAYVMSGVVEGLFPVSDGGPYEVILSKKSWENSNAGGWVQAFFCDCMWGQYHSGRPGAGWAGRMCSHAYAALMESNARAKGDFTGDRTASLKYNEDNFYDGTKAVWVPCNAPGVEPDYVSDSGSMYWHYPEGVVRGADHWGIGIGDCDWMLLGDEHISAWANSGDDVRYGFCPWNGFEDNMDGWHSLDESTRDVVQMGKSYGDVDGDELEGYVYIDYDLDDGERYCELIHGGTVVKHVDCSDEDEGMSLLDGFVGANKVVAGVEGVDWWRGCDGSPIYVGDVVIDDDNYWDFAGNMEWTFKGVDDVGNALLEFDGQVFDDQYTESDIAKCIHVAKRNGGLVLKTSAIQPRRFDRDSDEYFILEALADELNALCEETMFSVGDVYFDAGQGWVWTTVLAERNGESWQAVTPAEWSFALETGEVTYVAIQVVNGDYGYLYASKTAGWTADVVELDNRWSGEYVPAKGPSYSSGGEPPEYPEFDGGATIQLKKDGMPVYEVYVFDQELFDPDDDYGSENAVRNIARELEDAFNDAEEFPENWGSGEEIISDMLGSVEYDWEKVAKMAQVYNFDIINRVVERILDIKKNQFANWQSLYDIQGDEDVLNLFNQFRDMTQDDFDEACRRAWEEISTSASKVAHHTVSFTTRNGTQCAEWDGFVVPETIGELTSVNLFMDSYEFADGEAEDEGICDEDGEPDPWALLDWIQDMVDNGRFGARKAAQPDGDWELDEYWDVHFRSMSDGGYMEVYDEGDEYEAFVTWPDGASVGSTQLGDGPFADFDEAGEWCEKTYNSPTRGAARRQSWFTDGVWEEEADSRFKFIDPGDISCTVYEVDPFEKKYEWSVMQASTGYVYAEGLCESFEDGMALCDMETQKHFDSLPLGLDDDDIDHIYVMINGSKVAGLTVDDMRYDGQGQYAKGLTDEMGAQLRLTVTDTPNGFEWLLMDTRNNWSVADSDFNYFETPQEALDDFEDWCNFNVNGSKAAGFGEWSHSGGGVWNITWGDGCTGEAYEPDETGADWFFAVDGKIMESGIERTLEEAQAACQVEHNESALYAGRKTAELYELVDLFDENRHLEGKTSLDDFGMWHWEVTDEDGYYACSEDDYAVGPYEDEGAALDDMIDFSDTKFASRKKVGEVELPAICDIWNLYDKYDVPDDAWVQVGNKVLMDEDAWNEMLSKMSNPAWAEKFIGYVPMSGGSPSGLLSSKSAQNVSDMLFEEWNQIYDDEWEMFVSDKSINQAFLSCQVEWDGDEWYAQLYNMGDSYVIEGDWFADLDEAKSWVEDKAMEYAQNKLHYSSKTAEWEQVAPGDRFYSPYGEDVWVYGDYDGPNAVIYESKTDGFQWGIYDVGGVDVMERGSNPDLEKAKAIAKSRFEYWYPELIASRKTAQAFFDEIDVYNTLDGWDGWAEIFQNNDGVWGWQVMKFEDGSDMAGKVQDEFFGFDTAEEAEEDLWGQGKYVEASRKMAQIKWEYDFFGNKKQGKGNGLYFYIRHDTPMSGYVAQVVESEDGLGSVKDEHAYRSLDEAVAACEGYNTFGEFGAVYPEVADYMYDIEASRKTAAQHAHFDLDGKPVTLSVYYDDELGWCWSLQDDFEHEMSGEQNYDSEDEAIWGFRAIYPDVMTGNFDLDSAFYVSSKTAMRNVCDWTTSTFEGDSQWWYGYAENGNEVAIELDYNASELKFELYYDGILYDDLFAKENADGEIINLDEAKERVNVYAFEDIEGVHFQRDYWGNPILSSRQADFKTLRDEFGYTIADYLADLGFKKDGLDRYTDGYAVIYKKDNSPYSGWRAGVPSTGEQADFGDIDRALDWLDSIGVPTYRASRSAGSDMNVVDPTAGEEWKLFDDTYVKYVGGGVWDGGYECSAFESMGTWHWKVTGPGWEEIASGEADSGNAAKDECDAILVSEGATAGKNAGYEPGDVVFRGDVNAIEKGIGRSMEDCYLFVDYGMQGGTYNDMFGEGDMFTATITGETIEGGWKEGRGIADTIETAVAMACGQACLEIVDVLPWTVASKTASVKKATRLFTYAEQKELEDEIEGRELHNADRFKDGGMAYYGAI